MTSVTMTNNSELKHKQHDCRLVWKHEYNERKHEYNENYVHKNATDSKMGQILPYGHVI